MRCFWCQKKLTKKTATFDHLVPTCYGGKNTKNNKIISCNFCNSLKGNRLFFMEKDVFELSGQEKPEFVKAAQEIIRKLKKMSNFDEFFGRLSYGNQLYIENIILLALRDYDNSNKTKQNNE